ncbi:hypothetical protein HDU86_000062 [Geranomyces michiganensis]|nr:hypothetical protein HDU86_000062 [Geranomyces michiganensis]
MSKRSSSEQVIAAFPNFDTDMKLSEALLVRRIRNMAETNGQSFISEGRVEYFYEAFGQIIILLIEAKNFYDDNNNLAQVMCELDAANHINCQTNLVINPIRAVLTDRVNFGVVELDTVTHRFDRLDERYACLPGHLSLAQMFLKNLRYLDTRAAVDKEPAARNPPELHADLPESIAQIAECLHAKRDEISTLRLSLGIAQTFNSTQINVARKFLDTTEKELHHLLEELRQESEAQDLLGQITKLHSDIDAKVTHIHKISAWFLSSYDIVLHPSFEYKQMMKKRPKGPQSLVTASLARVSHAEHLKSL